MLNDLKKEICLNELKNGSAFVFLPEITDIDTYLVAYLGASLLTGKLVVVLDELLLLGRHALLFLHY